MRPQHPFSGQQRHLEFSETQSIEATGILYGQVSFEYQGCRYLRDSLASGIVVRFEHAERWLKSSAAILIEESIVCAFE